MDQVKKRIQIIILDDKIITNQHDNEPLFL